MKNSDQYDPPRVREYGGFEQLTRGQGSHGGDGQSHNGRGDGESRGRGN